MAMHPVVLPLALVPASVAATCCDVDAFALHGIVQELALVHRAVLVGVHSEAALAPVLVLPVVSGAIGVTLEPFATEHAVRPLASNRQAVLASENTFPMLESVSKLPHVVRAVESGLDALAILHITEPLASIHCAIAHVPFWPRHPLCACRCFAKLGVHNGRGRRICILDVVVSRTRRGLKRRFNLALGGAFGFGAAIGDYHVSG
mmetsp:Transcript_65905/g.183616  ORF Transcript_65905/g.183616 Transcript_65905/m.183616 type:complete len:205 (-) Transcript_65905:368-982(-)